MSLPPPAVAPTDLAPYLGRFVRLVVNHDGVDTTVRGFLTAIRVGTFVLDDIEFVAMRNTLRAYNITNELIAGKED